MHKLSTTVLLMLMTLCALNGCDHSRQQIVGKWKSSGASEMVWEFNENGTLSANGNAGRYTFGDNRRIKIQTPAATFVHQFEISGDRMIWTDANGSKTDLVRVK